MPMSNHTDANRRPIAARGSRAMQTTAALLARSGISPNAISVASIAFAALGAWAAWALPAPWGALACAASIVLRLLCNLFDGMVAVEWSRKTPTGALFNEVPDRIADTLYLATLGAATGDIGLGWCAALFAALTAYVRTLGGALGLTQDFRGPMAKQHRMWLLVVALVAGTLPLPFADALLPTALWIVVVGSALTCVARLTAIARALRAAAADAPDRC